VYKVLFGKPEVKRLRQIRGLEQEYNIKRDLRLDGCGLKVFGLG
jgi:hypothetical protein